MRPLRDEELGQLPLFAGLHAAASLVRITRALGARGQDEAPWLAHLRKDLTGMARAHRQLAIDTGRDL